MVDTVAQVVDELDDTARNVASIDDVLAAEAWARTRARELTSGGQTAGHDPRTEEVLS